MTEPLHRSLRHILTCIAEVGGSADVDRHGRLVAGPTKHVIQGDAVTYLILVSKGLLAGERGKIILTEEGRSIVDGAAGRERKAS